MTNAPSVTLDDVVVSGCKSQTMGGGLHSVNSKPIIKHSIFFGNRGGNDNSGNNNRGGGAYLQTSSHATLVNVSFIDNILGASGKGAGLNVDEDSNVTANGLTFRGNKAFFAAGLFVGHGCHGTFSNIYATENEASYGAAIGVFEGGNPTFNTGLVTANVASLWGAGVIVYTGANAHFEAMSFENNRAEIGGGLFMYSQATATVTNSRMLSNVVTKYGAGVRLDDRSTLKLTNTRVSNNVATLGGGGVHVTSGAILTVVGGEMVNNTATDGAAMYCSGGSHGGGKIIASDVSVTSNTAQGLGGGVFASEACGVTITGASVFESNTASSGSSCQSLYQVGGGAFALEPNTEAAPTTVAIVGATSVSSNKAPNGGAFFVVPAPNSADANSPKGAQISLSGSTTVSSNLALGCEPSLHGRGGAFFAAAGNHTFATTTFTNNSASDDGGAVYTEGVSAVTLSACTLSGNAAASFGGAVAHTGAKLKIEAGTIQSNTAIGGGGVYIAKASSTNAASPMFAILAASMLSNNAHRGGAMYYATDLALGVLSQNALSANNATAGSDTYWLRAKSPSSEFACTACTYAHADGSSSGVIATEALGARPAMVIANRVESGKVTSDFSVQLVDFYNHAVQSEISPVTCDVEAVNDPSALARHSLEISGVAESATSNGVATFSGAIMRGVLGESYVAKVTCARDSSANLGAISSLELDVSIGLCLPGSEPLLVTHSDGVAVARECTVCKDRTFNFDGVKCKACPEGGDCRGGTSLDSLQGWWRSADSAEVLFTCPIRESCVAGNGTGAASCELGYEGPVCALCSPGYRHWGGKCSPCGSNASLAVPALGIIAFVAFLVYIFRKPLKTAVGTVIFSTVLFVAQILGLLKEYDINWPQSVGRLVEVLDITNFNMESLTPGCSGSKSSYYDTYITAVVVPPSVTLFCILVYISMGLIERNSPFPRLNKIACDARTKCRRNACWLVVLSYSGVAKTVLQLYNQRHLDVGVYLRRDYSIDASGSEHLVYRITGFIALVLYPVGIPAVITFILLRNRHRLGDAQVQANFGFLYTNVRTELPFWELTGLFLKFVLAATPVFANERILRMKRSSFDTSSEFNGATQLNMAQFFVGIVFIATLCVQPYKKGLHNVQYSLASGIVFAWITLSANVFNSERTYTEREKTAVAAVAVAISSLVLLVAFIFSIIRGEFKHKPKDASDDKDSARDDDEDVESLKKKSLPP
jgi:predicted outer membrane repeat protein